MNARKGVTEMRIVLVVVVEDPVVAEAVVAEVVDVTATAVGTAIATDR